MKLRARGVGLSGEKVDNRGRIANYSGLVEALFRMNGEYILTCDFVMRISKLGVEFLHARVQNFYIIF